ncbi:hypothetical protein BDR26DRAFT_854906, partial [Obelidium mucronatum]
MSVEQNAAAATASAPANVAPATPKDDDLPKVFVGNLSFQTTDAELTTFFSTAGEVVRARVIRRFGRSQGYGFVSFKTQEAVDKAVQTLHKSTLQERQINVDAARPRAPLEEGAAAAEPKKPRTPKAKKDRVAKKDDGEGAEARIDSAGAGSADGGVAAPASVAANAAAAAGDDAKPLKKRNNKKKNKKPAAAAETAASAAEGTTAPAATAAAGDAAAAAAPAKPRTPRAPRAPRSKVDGPSSKTTLFVTNLPFKVDSEALKTIFAEYKVASAKVVTLRNGRSKGYGFVELVNEAEQQKVLKDLEEASLNVDGRDLSIRVALTLEEKVVDAPAAAAPAVAVA